MRVEQIAGARAWLAALMISALAVSAFGQTTPTAAQQPPTPQVQPPATKSASPVLQQKAPPMPTLPSTEALPQPAGPTTKLTLDQAVQSALEQNLNLQVQRIEPRISDYSLAQAHTAWLPSLSTSFSYNNAQAPIDLSYLGTTASVNASNFTNVSTGVGQLLPWWGSSFSAQWAGSRSEATAGQSFNPQTKGQLNFNFSQPILRNMQIDGARQGLLIGKVNREMSDITLRAVVVNTVRSVKLAYWNLVGARSNLDVAQQSLELSRQTLKDNQTRVEVGTMAPIDIVQAQAEVASNESSVIVLQAQVQQMEDNLRTLIFDPQSPDFWNQHLEPVDAPAISTVQIDPDAAVKSALEKRTDLLQSQKVMEQSQINIRYTKNQTLPALNFNVGYQTNALGGLSCQRDFTTRSCAKDDNGNVIPLSVGYGSVLKDTFSATYPSWTVGVSLSYPIGTSNAQLGLARARLQYHESELQLREQQMVVGQQVRDVVRRVNTNLKQIEATRAARELSERKLEAEQKKFAVGLSTAFLVVQAQRDLATARYNEVSAILNYTTSLADYEAVQETSVGSGTGGTVTLANSSSNGQGVAGSNSFNTGR
jgi:outer membrane protein